jgi:NTP pyrophosphatase (non-canonical NTP hydrolase)
MADRTCTYRDKRNTLCCTECGSDLSLCQCPSPDEQAQERWTSPDGLVIKMITDELAAAREAFPGKTHMLAALVEEVGELAQAIMQHDRKQETSVHEVLREAVQVACMAIRVAVEGDDNFLYQFPVVEEELPRGPVGRQYD